MWGDLKPPIIVFKCRKQGGTCTFFQASIYKHDRERERLKNKLKCGRFQQQQPKVISYSFYF